MADVSRFGTRVRRRWDEEDESDVDDLLIIAGLLEGSKRNKCKKKFHGSLPVLLIMLIQLTETDESTAKQVFCSFSCFPCNVLLVVKSCGDMRDFSYQLVRFVCRNMMAISSVSYLVCVLGYVVYLPVK